MEYRPRVVDKELSELLASSGATLIEGAKWCGKTTTAMQQAASVLAMQDPAERTNRLTLAQLAPQTLLAGATPRLLDEWQDAPQLWDAARGTIDQRGLPGQFILTGSTTPVADGTIAHTGTGRISRMRMRPMTLTESGDAPGGYSLTALFAGQKPEPVLNPLEIEPLLELICRGGWPSIAGQYGKSAVREARNYIDSIADSDIHAAADSRRDPVRMRAVLRSLARFSASAAPATHIAQDVSARDATEVHPETVSEYLTSLERIFVTEPLRAWSPALRSKTVIRSGETRHFVDPSLAAASLRIGPKDLLNDLNTAGLFFETLCVRDLQVYAQALDGDVYHYRDKKGREVDAVIHLRNGQWGLIEIKLGSHVAQEAAERLRALAEDINTDTLGTPAFLMILTGTGTAAYQMDNGVHCVPIACLGL